MLVPILRAGKHLMPKPGADLEVEKPLSPDLAGALQLREAFLNEGNPSNKEILLAI